jgi:hypothetical protein
VNAVLAAIGRGVLGAVLLLVALASCLLAVFGPPAAWKVALTGVVFVVVSCAVRVWIALQPKGDGDG